MTTFGVFIIRISQIRLINLIFVHLGGHLECQIYKHDKLLFW